MKKFNTAAVNLLFFVCALCFCSNLCQGMEHGICGTRPTYIVTCASGELGGATARLLAAENHLIITGRDIAALEKLQQELKSKYPWRYEICPLDYTKSQSIDNFKSYLAQFSIPISGLVIITPRPLFYGKEILQEEEAWFEVIRSTFTGPLEALKGVLPHLKQQGSIVVIAGTTSVQFHPDAGPGCVIRRMWTTYTKALAHELGPRGIRVNALSPGVVLTQFHQERIQNKAWDNDVDFNTQMRAEVANIPLRRHAKPEEVAGTVKFLLSEDSNFVTGINLILDGGLAGCY